VPGWTTRPPAPRPAEPAAPSEEDRQAKLLRLHLEASAYQAALDALPPLPHASLLAFVS
jgi:hypothetical protein